METGSIISKKAAEGLRALVLDIKVGKGAISNDGFMKELAKALVRMTPQYDYNS